MSIDLFHDPITRTGNGANKKRRMRLWWRFEDGEQTAPRVYTFPDDFIGLMTDEELDELMLDLAPRLARRVEDIDRRIREKPPRPQGRPGGPNR